MELVAIIATIILLSTLITMIFSFAAYIVTRAKASMKSKAKAASGGESDEDNSERIFFVRYDPQHPEGIPARAAANESTDQWR
jgi:hypothetical protein